MILNCKTSQKPVAVIMDGVAYITDDFCYEQHVMHHGTIKVSEEMLQEKIKELE